MAQKMRQVLLFTLLLVLLSQYIHAAVDLALNAKITDGIAQADQAVDMLTSGGKLKKFKKVVSKLVTKLRSFLSILGPTVAILSAVLPSGESEELKFMRAGFLKVNRRFDVIEGHLADLKRIAHWYSTADSYVTTELKIRALHHSMTAVFKSNTKTELMAHKASFKMQYETDGGLSLKILFQGFVNDEDRLLSKNIYSALMNYTKFHRSQVQKFMKGSTRIITLGMEVEVAYWQMFGKNGYKTAEEIWQKNLNTLESHMLKVDNQVKEQYLRQVRIDVDSYIKSNSGLGNRELSEKLLALVQEKYFWRCWFVVVFNEKDSDSRGYKCGGHVHRGHGFTVITASVDMEQANSDYIQNVIDPYLSDIQNKIAHATHGADLSYDCSWPDEENAPREDIRNAKFADIFEVYDHIKYGNMFSASCARVVFNYMRKDGIYNGRCSPTGLVLIIQSEDVWYDACNMFLKTLPSHVSHKKLSSSADTWIIVFG